MFLFSSYLLEFLFLLASRLSNISSISLVNDLGFRKLQAFGLFDIVLLVSEVAEGDHDADADDHHRVVQNSEHDQEAQEEE